MNFYKHYIGDFQRDTGHLSLTERGAYLALMHHYYATEQPLPKDVTALFRIAGAVTKAERDSVKSVLAFFKEMESGLVHQRIESELQKAGVRADKNKQIAIEREAKRRADKQAAEDARSAPQKAHVLSTNRAQNVQPDVSRNSNLYQTPDTRHQINPKHTLQELEPPRERALDQPPDSGVQVKPSPAAEACIAIRQAGIPDVNPAHPKLLALLDAGAAVEEFAFAARDAKDKGKGFAYLLGTVGGRRADAARLASTPSARASPRQPYESVRDRERREVIEGLTGKQNHDCASSPDSGLVIDITPAGKPTQSAAIGVD